MSIKLNRQNMLLIIMGAACGFVNGLIGAAGGMLAVFLLSHVLKFEKKQAHASALIIILPACIVTAIIYAINKNFAFNESLIYLPGALIGSILGAKLLNKIPDKILRFIFGIFALYSAVRIFLNA